MNIRILTSLLLPIGLCTFHVSAQPVILVGQTSGANVQYTDLSPDSVTTLCAPYSQGIPIYFYDTLRLDLDADGLDDLNLPMAELSEHMEQASLQAFAVNGASIAIASPSANSPAPLALGDSIHGGLAWSSSPWLGQMVIISYATHTGPWRAPIHAYIGVRTGSMRFGWVEVGITSPSPRCMNLSLYGYGVLTSPLGQGEEAAISAPVVWPNPAQGQVELRWLAHAGKAVIRVCDLQGRVLRVQEEMVGGYGLSAQIDLTGLADGVYVVDVTCGKRHGTARVMLNK